MHSLHVDVEVFVLQLEAVQNEGDCEVPELDQLRKAKIDEAAAKPEDEFDQFELRVDNLFE